MSEQTFEADSVEAALEKAAAALDVEAADLEHEVVEKKQDFWGMGDTYVIKAWERAAAETTEPTEPGWQPEATATVEAPATREPVPGDEPGAARGGGDEAPTVARDEPAAAEPEEEAAAVGGPGRGTERSAEGPAEAAGAFPEASQRAAAEESEESEAGDAVPGDAVSDDRSRGVEGAETAERGRAAPAASGSREPGFDPAAEGPVEAEQIGALLAQIFHDMEFDCTVDVEVDDDGFSATISGADKDEVLEGNGRCLSALELLVNNAFRNRMSRGEKIRVDAGDFRSRRDQELTDLAYQVAHSAKETGKTQETQELNPYERRLVHLALAEDQAVTTKSRGGGFLKNVQVIPESRGRGGGGRSRR